MGVNSLPRLGKKEIYKSNARGSRSPKQSVEKSPPGLCIWSSPDISIVTEVAGVHCGTFPGMHSAALIVGGRAVFQRHCCVVDL